MYYKNLEKNIIKRINRAINYARNYSLYYQNLFKKIRLPEKIKAFSQFEAIPITFRDDLAKRNDEFIAVSKAMWADVAATSGTGGNPIYIPFIKNDITRNTIFIAKKFSIFGLQKDDIAYITVPVDKSMWIGGLSVWLGCLKIGACCLRAGDIGIEKHMEFIKKFKPTVIFGIPSFILRLGEEVRARKYLTTFKPRLVVTFGENIMNRDFSRNALGKAIETLWKAKTISGYGATEGSPGFECVFQLGHHILLEMTYVEIVDPKTLKVLEEGKEGLVVMTHFGREGMSLIRYANGDISFLCKEKCKCGRIMPRLGPILRRTDEMIKIKGVNIYPSQIRDFLLGISYVQHFFIELFTDKDCYDKIRIFVKLKTKAYPDININRISDVQNRLRDKFGVKLDIEELTHYKEDNLKVKKSYIIDKRMSSNA